MLCKKTQGILEHKNPKCLISLQMSQYCYFIMNFICRLHEELRRSIEAQMEIVRQGEGSGVEKEVMENMRHQLQLLSQVSKISFFTHSLYFAQG